MYRRCQHRTAMTNVYLMRLLVPCVACTFVSPSQDSPREILKDTTMTDQQVYSKMAKKIRKVWRRTAAGRNSNPGREEGG